MPVPRVAVVGAGPIGLEVAYELRQVGIEPLHFDKAQVASTVAWYPEQATFFSSRDRIGICGIPLQTVGERKATKEEYLAYLRMVAQARGLEVRTYETVVRLEPRPGGGFVLDTTKEAGIGVDAVVLATGDMARPRRLGIEGEDLPHVSHYFETPHPFFRRKLLVVGGKNSAVEAALRCWHAGADVTISYRRAAFDARAVKYWLLPELQGRIRRGEIACHLETTPVAITPDAVRLDDGRTVPADFVLLLTGYVADPSLFEQAGARLEGDAAAPAHDPRTMETSVPGLYVAGTASAGTQQTFRLFIENCHIHALRIAAALTGRPPPPDPPPLTQPES